MKFIKLIMGLKSYTQTVMARGETGCLPTTIDIQCEILNFWQGLTTKKKEGCIAKTHYSHLFEIQQNRDNTCQWVNFIKNCLDDLGISYIFDSQGRNINPLWFKLEIKKNICDVYIQIWNSDLYDNKVCTNCRILKKDFALEKYLIDCLNSVRIIKLLCEYIFQEMGKIPQSALFVTRIVVMNIICCSHVLLSGSRGTYWWENYSKCDIFW